MLPFLRWLRSRPYRQYHSLNHSVRLLRLRQLTISTKKALHIPPPLSAASWAVWSFFCSSSSSCSGRDCLIGPTLPLPHGQVVVCSSPIMPDHFNCYNTGTSGPLSSLLDPFVLPASTSRETTILHPPETRFETKRPSIRTSFSWRSSKLLPSLPTSAASPSTLSSSALEVESPSQMHRLQILFEHLHREISAAGGVAGGSNLRVAELNGRIAEVLREDNENNRGRASHVDEVEHVPPPAYELDPV